MMVEKVIQHLEIISYYGNPFSKIIERHETTNRSSFIENNYDYDYDIFITLYNSNAWNHFRFYYFLSKFRKKFLSWMWKAREKQIQQRFHPSKLLEFLQTVDNEDGEALDAFIDEWINDACIK